MRSISGTNMFMNRMENATPSGEEAKKRMRPVMRPQPTPKMILPVGVMGVVV